MSKCSKCGAENRQKARYCKKCGAAIEQQSAGREGYYGKESLEEELLNFYARSSLVGKRKSSDGGNIMGLDVLILGPQGCGKKFIANQLTAKLVSDKVVDPAQVTEIDASEYRNWSEQLDEHLEEIQRGVLIITNVHKLLSGADSSAMTDLDALFARMTKRDSQMPIIMMTGLFNDMEAYLEKNPNISGLFEFHFRPSHLNEKALTGLTAMILKERFGLKVTAEAEARLKGHYEWMVRLGNGTSGNGHLAVKKAEELATNMFKRRKGDNTIIPEDVKGEVFVPRTEEEIWEEMSHFVGLQSVKDEIQSIIDKIHKAQKREGSDARITIRDHYVFTGNPGTGKTTIARKFAEILAAVGALPKGQFIEVDPSKIIGQYVGDTEKNMRDLVDKAMGGVLFIDEAYGLSNSQFGQSGIDTLVPLAENNKGKFICILAGYKREMGDFMKKNSGLQSRFNKQIDFPDYNPKELAEMFLQNAKRAGYRLSVEAAEKLHIPMEQMYNRRTELFGNGREVRNFFDAAVERNDKRTGGDDRELTYADIVGEEATKEVNANDVLAKLDELVGLDDVKNDLRQLAADINGEMKKALRKGTSPKITVDHYLFLGNPGTGKTTVARMMGQILKGLGVLATDEVIEVGRADLVASYVGQTAQKTTDAVMRAMGGILFIDEAYSLNNGPQDSFGKECIDTLVPLVLNNKGKFVCILAGYTKEMRDFVSVNSGIQSRFTNKLIFADYNAQQLMEIFRRQVARNDFRLDAKAESRAAEIFTEMYNNRDSNFGNAREVGNYYEKVRKCHNVRLLAIEDSTEEQEVTFTIEDIERAYNEMKKMKL